MAKYLITGGAGFIGSNIARELAALKHEVVVLDNLYAGKISNLADITDRITFINGDIRDLALMKKSFVGVDYVLHQAALRGVLQSVEDPSLVNDVNVTGTLNVLLAAREAGVKRVVFASSSSVYGKTNAKTNVESLPSKPESPYALTKLAGEEYCHLFYTLFGLQTVSLRYFNVFGPFQSPSDPYAAVIPIFIQNAIANKPSVIHGNGKQSRDFTFVKNIVQANILASKSKTVRLGENYNISSGENITIKKLHDSIQILLNKKIPPIFTDSRAGDIKKSFGNIKKANKFLTYNPKTSFSQGLKITLNWYKQNT